VIAAIEKLLVHDRAGDPVSGLQWTRRTTEKIASQLRCLGLHICPNTVGRILKQLGFSLRVNQKKLSRRSDPDRDEQFVYIGSLRERFTSNAHPVVSIDTKKKELVGNFKNPGREWRPKGEPEPVQVHDFIIPEQGKAIPYGVYDLSRNEGWVSIGVDHDTARFAVHAIERWWEVMGRAAYPKMRSLLITADSGGSNGSRLRLWKWELQEFANRHHVSVSVCHLPPGTSKWNKIEHRLFSYIAMNWRGKPLVSLAAIVSLIGATTTRRGLRVRSEIDHGTYPAGVKITDAQMSRINLERHHFHGDWNYTIHPVVQEN
jgi:hypothetical protein